MNSFLQRLAKLGRAEAERDSAKAKRERVETELREARNLADRQTGELTGLRE